MTNAAKRLAVVMAALLQAAPAFAQAGAVDGARRTVLSGVVRSTDAETIYAPMSNTSPVVLRQLAPDGAAVKPGDVLVRIDPGAATAQINAQVDRLRPDLVIIDNINIMLEPFAYAGENDVKRIGRISRNLKVMCNDLNIPVVCICHMNRGSEARADKRPVLADLRESGE